MSNSIADSSCAMPSLYALLSSKVCRRTASSLGAKNLKSKMLLPSRSHPTTQIKRMAPMIPLPMVYFTCLYYSLKTPAMVRVATARSSDQIQNS